MLGKSSHPRCDQTRGCVGRRVRSGLAASPRLDQGRFRISRDDDEIFGDVVSDVFEEDRRSQTQWANITLRRQTIRSVVGGSRLRGGKNVSREIKTMCYRMVSMIFGVALTGDISHWFGLRWRRTRRDAHTGVMGVSKL